MALSGRGRASQCRWCTTPVPTAKGTGVGGLESSHPILKPTASLKCSDHSTFEVPKFQRNFKADLCDDPPVNFEFSRYQVNKENKKHLERLLNEGKHRIIAYMEKHGMDASHVKSVKNDRFTGHPFEKF